MVLTEDEVRDQAKIILGFDKKENNIQQGTGQITTFNQLGFKGIQDKPDGWYLPNNKNDVAIILETKSGLEDVNNPKWFGELKKNILIASKKYKKIIGIIYNGEDVFAIKYQCDDRLSGESWSHIENLPIDLQNKNFYLGLFNDNKIDKQKIYLATKAINDALHYGLTLKDLYHRMIFTACALVATRYDAELRNDSSYDVLRYIIKDKLKHVLDKDIRVNAKLQILIDRFDSIKAETPDNAEAISIFVNRVKEISEYFISSFWQGEDVMAIFFNEFNRYKGRTESGQVFTPDHIASLMYRLIEVNKDDKVLDAACGSGTFLVKSMCRMINEAGGSSTSKALNIKKNQLFGIEKDQQIYALACANMLIHKDGKTNLENLDARYEAAYHWIKSKNITKVLMNPPFESKNGCLDIVLNVLNAVYDNNPSLHHKCAFILPDKKLEKKNQTRRVKKILKKHRLIQIIKLPEKTFEGVNTSIFVFECGKPQNDNKIFGCYIKEDGLDTVKNQGRQDVYGKWEAIEDYWIKVVNHEIDDPSIIFIDPKQNLSYVEKREFIIRRSLFNTIMIERNFYHDKIDFSNFCESFSQAILYQADFPMDQKNYFEKLLLLAKNYKGDQIIDTNNWEYFDLKEILKQTGRGTRLKKHYRIKGSIPLATAGFKNQGISEYIDCIKQEIHEPSITIDMFCNCFLREYNFACDDNVYVYQPQHKISKEAMLFIVAIINNYSQRFSNKYNYDNQFREQKFLKEKIKLPVNQDGTPDYEWMEEYIKKLPYNEN